jgi:5'-methylthioadenosine phosphorylase
MSMKLPNKTITRREALALGIPGAAMLAAGTGLMQAAETQGKTLVPDQVGKAQVAVVAPDKEHVDFAIINRDRKWLDLESMATLEKSFTIDTPIGPSPLIRKLRYKDAPFYYLPRYGDAGSGEIAATADEEFPGQRTVQIWVTLMTLGVRNVLHGNLIGAVNTDYAMTDAAIVNDFIDFKPNHPQSILPYFFKGKADVSWKRWGTRMNPVLCPDLRRGLYNQAVQYHFAKVHNGGTLAQTHTDRWETPAEVRMLKAVGADLTCTLDGTYIIYAKQAGIHFATIMQVMNYGEGLRPDAQPMISSDDMQRCAVSMRKTMLETVAALKGIKHTCNCFKLQEEKYRAIFPYTT